MFRTFVEYYRDKGVMLDGLIYAVVCTTGNNPSAINKIVFDTMIDIDIDDWMVNMETIYFDETVGLYRGELILRKDK